MGAYDLVGVTRDTYPANCPKGGMLYPLKEGRKQRLLTVQEGKRALGAERILAGRGTRTEAKE